MKRSVRPDEARLWSMVAATVHPMPGRVVPVDPAGPRRPIDPDAPAARIDPHALSPKPVKRQGPAQDIEPGRKHRIARERDPIGAHIDLHGMTQERARASLERFVIQSWHEGFRAVLVITGKGLRGDGVLRRMTPEWLAAQHLREVVAGISESHRRHGGEGALYIALKRKARG